MNIYFSKMHGLGNDFVLIDNFKGKIKLSSRQIKFICERHFGVGADGLILLESSKKADCFMNYYNADGTEAEMCGNGLRSTARFFLEKTKKIKNEILIETRAGIKKVIYNKDGTFSVFMGKPIFSHRDFPDNPLKISDLYFECVSVGNPHAITFVDNVDDIAVNLIGPQIENDKHFPNKINVHFVEKINNNKLKMRTWERGSGMTLACGTGATAVYALSSKKGYTKSEIDIKLPGGVLKMSQNKNGEIILSGPAEKVYDGELELK